MVIAATTLTPRASPRDKMPAKASDSLRHCRGKPLGKPFRSSSGLQYEVYRRQCPPISMINFEALLAAPADSLQTAAPQATPAFRALPCILPDYISSKRQHRFKLSLSLARADGEPWSPATTRCGGYKSSHMAWMDCRASCMSHEPGVGMQDVARKTVAVGTSAAPDSRATAEVPLKDLKTPSCPSNQSSESCGHFAPEVCHAGFQWLRRLGHMSTCHVLYIYISIYTCVYIYVHVYIYIYIYLFIYLFICVYIYIYTCMCMYVCFKLFIFNLHVQCLARPGLHRAWV